MKYLKQVGTRAEVWNGIAYRTSGGMTKDKLYYPDSTGRIKSIAKMEQGRKLGKSPTGFKKSPSPSGARTRSGKSLPKQSPRRSPQTARRGKKSK